MADSSSYSLRPATPDDLDSVAAVEKRVHVAPWSRENFEGELAKPYSAVWVLTDDETDSKVLGYVAFWILDETAEILNLAVDLEFRGLGFAKRMLQSVIQESIRRGAKRLILDVRKSNLPATSLYQRSGFSITQYRKGFYSNGEDAYHLTLELEGAKLDF